MLERTGGPLDVFIVWEPVLVTDIVAPTTRTLSLLHDGRAWQAWDPRHFISEALKRSCGKGAASGAVAERVAKQDLLWDAAAVFPKGVRWEEGPPVPVYFDGDVQEVIPALTSTVHRLM